MRIYLLVMGITLIPVFVFGQLTSFNAGPKDGRYNICEGETVTLYTYNPYFDAGPNPVSVDWLDSPVAPADKFKQQPTFTPPAVGTYTFRVRMTDLTYNVSLEKSFNIVVVGKPLARAGSDVNLCMGDSYKLNAVETLNGVAVVWTHNGRGQILNANTLSPTYIPAPDELGQVKLTLKVTGNATCGGESTDDLILSYFPKPTADITIQSPQKICSNKQFTLNAVLTGNVSYKWNVVPNDRLNNLSKTNTLSPVYTPQINETGPVYIIVESIGAGCSVFDTLQMNVSQMVVVSSSTSGILNACPGEIVNMYVTSAPGFTYLWNTGSTANSIFAVAKERSEKFNVTATNKDGCTQTVDFTINPKPFPTVNFTSVPPTRLCGNETYKITASAQNYVSFKWNIVPKATKGSLLNENTLTPTYIPKKDEGGLVQIILETKGTECTVYDTLSLNVSQMVVEPSHVNGLVNTCKGEKLNLYVTTTPGCTFLWNTGAKTNSIEVVADGKTLKYSVEVTNQDGCKQVVDFNLNYKTAPVAKLSLLTMDKLCSNLPVKIKGEATGYTSIRWYLVNQDNKGTISEGNTLTPTYTPRKDESGPVQIVFEANGSECTTRDTLRLNIEPMNVEPSHPGGKVIACDGENVNLYVTASPGFTYLWSNGAKTNSILVKAKSPSSNYSVVVTNSNGCKETVNFTITTKSGPTADITTNANAAICSNQPLKVYANASNFLSFQWYVYPATGKGTLTDSKTLTPTYTPRSNETGEVLLILETVGTECTVYDTLKVKVSEIYFDQTNTNGNVTSCAGDPVTLAVTASPNYTYLWNNGEKTNSIITKPPIGSSNYSVEITNKDGCKQTASFKVTVNSRPSITLSLDAENTLITVSPTGLTRYVFLGKNKVTLQDGANNVYNFSSVAMTTDTIFVVAYSKDGCSSNLDNKYLDYILLPKLKLVDAFSPNNDGVNDRLMPGRKTTVIDRTSKILYEGWDGWDGKYLGKDMPQGTYYYLLYDEKGNIFYKGPVTLLRNNF